MGRLVCFLRAASVALVAVIDGDGILDSFISSRSCGYLLARVDLALLLPICRFYFQSLPCEKLTVYYGVMNSMMTTV